MKYSITYDLIKDYNNVEDYNFPKYTSQLIIGRIKMLKVHDRNK